MAEVKPLKLEDVGGGRGELREFGDADRVPFSLLGLGSAATRQALGLSGALYSRDSILGMVSQSGGVPTGAIIERGSNANGEYVRLVDGTQVCTRYRTFTSLAFGVSIGALYRNNAGDSATSMAAAFVGSLSSVNAFCVVGGGAFQATNIVGVQQVEVETLSEVRPVFVSATTTSETFTAVIFAIGRWY